MEYCAGGNLREILETKKKMELHEIHQLVRNMAFALLELNSMSIVHRDIKPENILIGQDRYNQPIFKLTDFGVSRFLDEGCVASTFTGTPGYYAPEALNDKHDARCDIWSLGVVVLECAIGEFPFGSLKEYRKLRSSSDIESLLKTVMTNVALQSDIKDLVKKMLVFDKTKRMTIYELCQNKIVSLRLDQVDPLKPRKPFLKRLFESKSISPFEANFDSLDDATLSRVLYYVGIRDRLHFGNVMTKWHGILNRDWGTTECRVFNVQNRSYKYSLRSLVGRGSFGDVYKGINFNRVSSISICLIGIKRFCIQPILPINK